MNSVQDEISGVSNVATFTLQSDSTITLYYNISSMLVYSLISSPHKTGPSPLTRVEEEREAAEPKSPNTAVVHSAQKTPSPTWLW